MSKAKPPGPSGRPELRAPRRRRPGAGEGASGKTRGRAPKPPRGPGWIDRAIRAVMRFLFGASLRLGAVFAIILAAAIWAMHAQLPPADQLLDGRDRGSVTLLDSKGEVFAWRGEQFGGEIRPGDVSPHLINAILAAEDRRFYGHWGVDPRGIARALVVNIRAGRVVQGGSTLTQQVAKNVFLTNERSIERKLKEIPMAFAMELKYAKDDILALYLNRVYLGAGTYGFEAASQRYFAKSAKFVSPAEAAMLAGLLKAPSRFAPTSDIGEARGRAAVILRAMREEGYLTEAQTLAALAEPASLSRAAAARIGAQFADWAMAEGPDYLTAGTTEDVVIRTTFDPAAQRAAEAALAHVFETQVRPGSKAQAAIVVMTPDGAVRAIVGGRDGRAGGFNRATQARRQTGSAFKPIVYAAGLERGMSPDDVIVDAPITLANWSPENYGGGHAGPVTLTDALARSINTVAVRVSEQAGRDRVRDAATRLGVTAPLAEGPALALGVSEASLLEMTGAYAAFANKGVAARPWGLREIRLRGDGAPLMTGGGPQRRALDHRVAALTTAMMEEVIRRGTGTRAALPDGRPAAGKTGTTQAARDAWFIGFTADYVAGVWMGYDDNTPLTGVTGGGLPAEIWRETMTRLHAGLPIRPLPSMRPERRPATRLAGAEPPPGGGDAQPDSESLLGGILADVMRALRE